MDEVSAESLIAEQRVTAVMKEIFEGIPAQLNVTGVLMAAKARLVAAHPEIPEPVLRQRVAEVLQEIATYTVEQFTRRTGQPFLWVDEPAFEPTDDNVLMSFHVNAQGVVGFGEPVAPPASESAEDKQP